MRGAEAPFRMKVAADTRNDLTRVCDAARRIPMRLPYRSSRDFRRIYGTKARSRKAAIWPRFSGRVGQNASNVQPKAISASRTRLIESSNGLLSSSVK